jgi:hypothetical protein
MTAVHSTTSLFSIVTACPAPVDPVSHRHPTTDLCFCLLLPSYFTGFLLFFFISTLSYLFSAEIFVDLSHVVQLNRLLHFD